jgi:hypothetical protein
MTNADSKISSENSVLRGVVRTLKADKAELEGQIEELGEVPITKQNETPEVPKEATEAPDAKKEEVKVEKPAEEKPAEAPEDKKEEVKKDEKKDETPKDKPTGILGKLLGKSDKAKEVKK